MTFNLNFAISLQKTPDNRPKNAFLWGQTKFWRWLPTSINTMITNRKRYVTTFKSVLMAKYSSV